MSSELGLHREPLLSLSAPQRFVGFDYGVRRYAAAIVTIENGQPALHSVQELVLPDYPCDLCQIVDVIGHVEEHFDFLNVNDVVAIERPITGRSGNARTAATLGMMAGALLGALSTFTARHATVSPSSWKAVAVGNGSATKAYVKQSLELRYGREFASQDIADAVGIATWLAATWGR